MRRSYIRLCSLCLSFGTLLFNSVYIDSALAQEAAPRPDVIAVTPKAKEADLNSTIALNLNNLPIDQLIKFLADTTGKPVLKHKSVNAQVTVGSPVPVTKRRALELIYDALLLDNIYIVEQENQLQILPADALKGIKLRTISVNEDVQQQPDTLEVAQKVYKLRDLSDDLINQLKKFMPESVVSADKRANTLVLTDRIGRLKYYDSVIHSLDQATSTGQTVEIIQLKSGEPVRVASLVARILSPSGSPPAGADGSAISIGDVTIIPNTSTSSIIISGPRNRIAEVRTLAAQFDFKQTRDISMRMLEAANVDSKALSAAITQMFPDMASKPESEQIRILPTGDGNRLMVYSSEKNFHMVEDMVKNLDKTGFDKDVTMRLIKVENADARTLYPTILPMIADSAAKQEKEQIKLTPSPDGKHFIINSSEKNFHLIEDIVKNLDLIGADKDLAMRIIKVQNVDAKAISTAIALLFPDNALKPEKDQIRMTPLPDNSSFIIYSSEKNFHLIEDMVKKLDEGGAGKDLAMRYIKVQNVDAKAVTAAIALLFPDNALKPEKDQIRVTPSPDGSNFIVYSSEKNFRLIEDMVKNLEQNGTGKDVTMRIIKSENVDAKAISTAIALLFPDNALKPEKDQIRVTASPDGNSFIIYSSEKNFQLIQDMVANLDKNGADKDVTMRLIDVENVDAKAVSAAITLLFPDNALKPDKEQIRVTTSPDGNHVMVYSSLKNFNLISDTVKNLDKSGPDKDVTMRVIKVENLDARSLSSAISLLFPDNALKPEKEQVRVTPSPDGNSFMVYSSRKNFDLLQGMIQDLDQKKTDKDLAMRLVEVKHIDANSVAAAIGQLFPEFSGKTEKERIKVASTEDGGALIVYSTQENFERVQELVRNMDNESTEKRLTQSYPIQHMQVQDLADQLTKLFEEKNNNQGYGYFYDYYGSRNQKNETKPSFVPSPRTSTLLVMAKPKDFDFITRMIKELDVPTDSSHFSPHVYQIHNTDAAELLKVLNTIFKPRSDQQNNQDPWWNRWRNNDQKKGQFDELFGEIRFVVDNVTNRIVALASNPRDYETIDRTIAELDKLDPEATDVLIIEMRYANADDMADRINNLFSDGVVQQLPAAQPAQSDKEKKDQQVKETAEAVRQVVMPWQSAGREKKDEKERPVNTMIGNVRVVPDRRSNKIIIAAPSIYFSTLREMVRKLDQPEPQVFITARIVHVVHGKDKRIGIRWTPDPGTIDPAELDNAITGLGQLGMIDSFGKLGSSLVNSTYGTRRTVDTTLGEGPSILAADVNITLLIQLLVKNSNSKIVSEPKISINNNETGNIFFGAEFPFQTNGQVTDVGSVNNTFVYQPVGLNLNITPHINSKGRVVLRSDLENSKIRPGEFVNGQIIKDMDHFRTELAVDSGQTMVIGGLRVADDQLIERHVPIIGSIPGLRHIFGKSDRTAFVRELVLFITPRVLQTREDDEKVLQETTESLHEIDQFKGQTLLDEKSDISPRKKKSEENIEVVPADEFDRKIEVKPDDNPPQQFDQETHQETEQTPKGAIENQIGEKTRQAPPENSEQNPPEMKLEAQ